MRYAAIQPYAVYSLLAALAIVTVRLSRYYGGRHSRAFHVLCITWALTGIFLCLAWCPVIPTIWPIDVTAVRVIERTAGVYVLVLCAVYFRWGARWARAGLGFVCGAHLFFLALVSIPAMYFIPFMLLGHRFFVGLGFLCLLACQYVFSICMLVAMARLNDYVAARKAKPGPPRQQT